MNCLPGCATPPALPLPRPPPCPRPCPLPADYRDSAPEPLSDVFELYQPVVQQGLWTHRLIEMW